MKNQGDQGKSESDIQYPALQEATTNDGDRIATLLYDVDEFIPREIWISKKWSPPELVSRHKLDTKLHRRSPFGSYCKVHVDPDITNTLDPRTKQVICMGPTGRMEMFEV
jgi:hypothetical protein